VHELQDKTKVNYWYKLLHEMLQHHARYLFCRDNFFDVSGVDITIGGDHGKGKSQYVFLETTVNFFILISFIFWLFYVIFSNR
jgi:hypothetical protein